MDKRRPSATDVVDLVDSETVVIVQPTGPLSPSMAVLMQPSTQRVSVLDYKTMDRLKTLAVMRAAYLQRVETSDLVGGDVTLMETQPMETRLITKQNATNDLSEFDCFLVAVKTITILQ